MKSRLPRVSRGAWSGALGALGALGVLALSAVLALEVGGSGALAGPGDRSLGPLPGPRVVFNELRASLLGDLFGTSAGQAGMRSPAVAGTAAAALPCAGYLCEAVSIRALPYTARADTTGQQPDPGAPTCQPAPGGQWYEYRPAADQLLVATAGGYPLSLGAFSGTSPATLTQLGCSQAASGAAQVGWLAATRGKLYYFHVSGLAGGGPLTFVLRSSGGIEDDSVANGGGGENGKSKLSAISPDGRFVVFISNASNLTSSTTCSSPVGCFQIYLRDRLLGTTIAVGPSVPQFQNGSNEDTIIDAAASANGRFIAFTTSAALKSEDTNASYDVYVYDRLDDSLELESTAYKSASAGTPPASAALGATCELPPPGAVGLGGACVGGSFTPSMSNDGRYVMFTSNDVDLVPSYNNTPNCSSPNCTQQVYLRDRTTKVTRMLSMAGGTFSFGAGSTGAALSVDGSRAVFMASFDGGAGQIYVETLATGALSLVSHNPGGQAGNAVSFAPVISGDGTHVGFISSASDLVTGDTNGMPDTFEWWPGHLVRISVTSGGAQQTPPAVAQNGAAPSVAISQDGRYAVLATNGANLGGGSSGDYQVYLHDSATGATTLLSVTQTGVPGDSHSFMPLLSADGLVVAFDSSASNLTSAEHCQAAGCFDVLSRSLS